MSVINKKTKTDKATKPVKKTTSTIIGIMQLFAVASICYSSTVIALGTNGVVPLVLIAPQVILAVVIAINKFTK